jgi:hypothetical protein
VTKSDERLAPDEDAELRRLHMLRGFGMVASTVSSRYETLRGRDRRKVVREPDEQSVAAPVEKKTWADQADRLRRAEQAERAERADRAEQADRASTLRSTWWVEQLGRNEPELVDSNGERIVGDSREIFGELPEPRRGLGLFRR